MHIRLVRWWLIGDGWYLSEQAPCINILSTSFLPFCYPALLCRALAVQLGFYEHMRFAVGAPAGAPLTPPVLFTVSFMLLFSVVIALFKVRPRHAQHACPCTSMAACVHVPCL